jgi:small subunit ribosomal protein S9
VRIVKGKGEILINKKALGDYFVLERLRAVILSPMKKLDLIDKFNVSVNVKGGGISAQAEAVRHGLSRALVIFDAELKGRLRGFGFLTRNPRMVERKKYGLKKARRAPQWAKR